MIKSSFFVGAFLISLQAIAHDIIIIPSTFSVNRTPSNVAVDISSTHGLFRIERSVGVDNITVLDVDAKPLRNIGTVIKGSTRTSFELPIMQEGTYKITYGNSEPGYTTSYTIGERETSKRLRNTNKSQALSQIPTEAKNITTSKSSRIAMLFINNKLPTQAVIEPTNKGFEFIPVTHPADYVNGEKIEFKILNDGKAVEGVQLEIKAEVSMYGRELEHTTLKTDKNGMASIEFEYGGRYVARITHQQDSTDPEADTESFTIFYQFEVIFE